MSDETHKRRRPTQADVARLAAVSQPLVSYVLSGDPNAPVAAETRARVLAAISELGYVPSHAARSLRSQKALTIGAIIPDITNPFYPAFARGIQNVAESQGYDLIAYNSDGLLERERKFMESALAGRVDGVILSPFQISMDELADVAEKNIPVVALTSRKPVGGRAPVDTVHVNSVAAARQAVEHLIQRGHQRIGMIAGEAGTPPREDRVLGYLQALEAAGMRADEMLVRGADFNEEGGYRAALDLLQISPRPTAIFAANDLMAMGAMGALFEAGLRIPQDMAIVGFDDIPAARLLAPPLTTVAQYPDRLGERTAELLLERLRGEGPPHSREIMMLAELVVRESA
ncbi:MAG: LacI family DNA-binding transcriptional regulator [Thermomicrobiales bacterium]